MKRYVIIGSSIAGLNAIDVLRQLDKESEIVLVSEETEIYSKCIMHFYMNGERTREGLFFEDASFFERNRFIWKKGVRANKVDTEHKTVILSDGDVLSYDKVLIATGSHAFIPPIKGIENAKQVLPFHTLTDCDVVTETAKRVKDIVILGAGLVGVDAAAGLCGMGNNITLIDMKEHMLSVQLDQKAASVYEEEFLKRGVKQRYGVGITEVVTDDEGVISKVILTDGSELPCQMLIIAAGTRANRELPEASGLEMDRFGLVLDKQCRTSAEDVYGAGDVTGRNLVWPAASKEAMTAAYNMAGVPRKMTDFFDGKSTINIFQIPTMAYGMPEPPDDSYQVDVIEGKDGSYQRMIHRDGKIYGVILQRNLYYSGILNQLISKKPDLSGVKKPLLELDYADLLTL